MNFTKHPLYDIIIMFIKEKIKPPVTKFYDIENRCPDNWIDINDLLRHTENYH